MNVTILGNNSALPAYGRHPTSQVVSVWGMPLLIDCGEGTQIRMQDYGIRWRNIDHIFISHLHGDHYFGIFGLITSMSLLGRTAPLNLHAPAPLAGIIRSIMDAAGSTLGYPFNFHPLNPAPGLNLVVDAKSFRVESFPTEHRIECHGFLITRKTKGRRILPEQCNEFRIPAYFYPKLKEGFDYEASDGSIVKNEWVTETGPRERRYAYCADTIFTDSFLPHIVGADAIYHESTYLEADAERAYSRFHATARQAAEIALKAGAGRLLLGHYSSRYKDTTIFQEEARLVFPNSVATEEGVTYEI